MRTAEEYVQSLRDLKTVVYIHGEKVDNFVDHPLIRPHINAASMTYQMAHDPRFADLMTVESHLSGKRINRFTHIHQSPAELIDKVKMLRAISGQTGSCYQRCVGFDAINALYSTTFDIDEKYGTSYHDRLKKYLAALQETENMVVGAMTDPKGDRSLSPGKQADPDLYTRIVEQNDEGIVIRGAKAHQTGAVNSHEMLIMPTLALGEEDKAYAVSCAIPIDAPGVFHVFGRQVNDRRKYDAMDQGNSCFGVVGGETLSVFEDVFVPWDRVFMCGEYDFAGVLVERFACLHRQNYGGCKGGVCDIIIGAAAALAASNNVARASHVKDKLVEMIHLTETVYGCSVACSAQGQPTASGAYMVDPLLANVAKLNVTRAIYEVCRLSHDIAGGFLATLPSERDFNHPEIGEKVRKYIQGHAEEPVEERYRLYRLLENMTAGTALVESMHGAGSPQAQRVMILRQGDLSRKADLARALAGIGEGPQCMRGHYR